MGERTDDTARRQADRLMEVVADANAGWPALKKRNPKLYKQITDEQREVAECRRRAAMNRDLLEMRLD